MIAKVERSPYPLLSSLTTLSRYRTDFITTNNNNNNRIRINEIKQNEEAKNHRTQSKIFSTEESTDP